jgi:hypothetical protein
MTAEWMLYLLPISIWFAAAASASVTAIVARQHDERRQQERLRLAFSRARSVRTGCGPIDRSY